MLEPITARNCDTYDRLVQAYEAEFAPITHKEPGPDGKYPLDSTWREPCNGYYWIINGSIVGFCIRNQIEKISDLAEFYIMPTYRKKGYGKRFAMAVFNHHPGKWQVCQIEGADKAKIFWRKVIGEYTSFFVEDQYQDDYWGPVIRQRFNSPQQV